MIYQNYERIFADSFLWSMTEYLGITASLKGISYSAKLEKKGTILIILSIEGAVDGKIILDIPQETAEALLERFAKTYEMSLEETRGLFSSILKEWLNLISGHAISLLEPTQTSTISLEEENPIHLNIHEPSLYIPTEQMIFYLPTRSIEIESEVGNSFLHFVHKKESFVHKKPTLVWVGLETELEKSLAHIILSKGFECIRIFQYIHIQEPSSIMDQLKGKNPDFCLLDWDYNPTNMSRIIPKFQEFYPLMRIIVLSYRRDLELLNQLKSLGVAGFIPKDLYSTPVLIQRLESILRRMGLCMIQDKRSTPSIPVPEKSFFQIHFPLPAKKENSTAKTEEFVIGKVLEMGIDHLIFTPSKDGNAYSSLKEILVESPEETFKEILLESEQDILFLEGQLTFIPREDLWNLKYTNLAKRSTEKLIEWLYEFQKTSVF